MPFMMGIEMSGKGGIGHADSLPAIAGASHHFHVALLREDGREPFADHGMIVGEQDADRHAVTPESCWRIAESSGNRLAEPPGA
jgi:hypothetical protein